MRLSSLGKSRIYSLFAEQLILEEALLTRELEAGVDFMHSQDGLESMMRLS